MQVCTVFYHLNTPTAFSHLRVKVKREEVASVLGSKLTDDSLPGHNPKRLQVKREAGGSRRHLVNQAAAPLAPHSVPSTGGGTPFLPDGVSGGGPCGPDNARVGRMFAERPVHSSEGLSLRKEQRTKRRRLVSQGSCPSSWGTKKVKFLEPQAGGLEATGMLRGKCHGPPRQTSLTPGPDPH